MDIYDHSIGMYKTKASLAVQFMDNVVVWSFVGCVVPLLLNLDKILYGEIKFTFFSVFTFFLILMAPITLIMFGHLKYKEYNNKWREGIIKALFADYLNKNESSNTTLDMITRYIQDITNFKYDEIITILYSGVKVRT
ncbi:MAG: hypothetical protein CVT89_01445 [Candidatus Altiarchaeales archaeon HGW-Altiarchaeales-2]|nr:MAG: hypothetical protein CVT89_01445 [Candidatus Altiarchaeales archaeon HGW-Altiarchaeales-2]